MGSEIYMPRDPEVLSDWERTNRSIIDGLQGLFKDGPEREDVRVVVRERVEERELAESQWLEHAEAVEQQA